MTNASRSSKKPLGWPFGVAAVLLAGGALLLFTNARNPALAFGKDTLGAGLAVATALLVVTLFVERGMAVVNALIFGEKERQAVLDLLTSNAGTRDAAACRLAEVLGWKERLRLLLSFAAGLFVAGAGVRTLAGVFELTDKSKPGLLFHDVDILLTAGLIAGGSNGLAFLIQALKTVIQGNTPPANVAPAVHLVTTG